MFSFGWLCELLSLALILNLLITSMRKGGYDDIYVVSFQETPV